EGLALLHVGQGGLVGGAGDADGLAGDADAAGVEHAHGDLEALPFFAQHLLRRDHVVLELDLAGGGGADAELGLGLAAVEAGLGGIDRKSTRLNSSHVKISYAVFCLKKKTPRRMGSSY